MKLTTIALAFVGVLAVACNTNPLTTEQLSLDEMMSMRAVFEQDVSLATASSEKAAKIKLDFDAKVTVGPSAGTALAGSLGLGVVKQSSKYTFLRGALTLPSGDVPTYGVQVADKTLYVFFDLPDGNLIAGKGKPDGNGGFAGQFIGPNLSGPSIDRGVWKATTPKTPSILEIATSDANFSTLVSAVKGAGLLEALSGAGPFTVFAPTNAAFAKLAALPAGDALKEVLLYHVAAGKFDAAALLKAGEVKTLQGLVVKVRQDNDGNVILNDTVKVVAANIAASNGIVHVIDSVLIPVQPKPSILEIAISNPNFSTLVSAVKGAGLVDALSGAGPLTVFAPTNAAFAKLAVLPAGDALKEVLLYHVAAGRIGSGTLAGVKEITTLSGKKVKVSRFGNGALVLNDRAVVLQPDIEASNGVVHVISDVLLFDQPQLKSIVDIAVADGRFKTLVAAVTAAGLADTLANDGFFTVFAPTDAAFAKLAALPNGEALKNVLLYHVLSGKITSQMLKNHPVVTSLLGQTITVSADGAGLVLNNQVKVIIADIEAANGIIHVIDTVLIPQALKP